MQEVGFLSTQGRDHVAVAVFVLVMIIVAECAHGFDVGRAAADDGRWTVDDGTIVCGQLSVVRRRVLPLKQRTEEPRQGGVDGVVAAAVRGQQADVGGFV